MIGVHNITIDSVEDAKTAGRDLHRIQLPALMNQEVVIPGRALRGKRMPDGFIRCF